MSLRDTKSDNLPFQYYHGMYVCQPGGFSYLQIKYNYGMADISLDNQWYMSGHYVVADWSNTTKPTNIKRTLWKFSL